MPDKKLTDSEIVKALRSWLEEIRKSRQAYAENVGEEHYPSMRYEYLLSDIIHAINRLQAENEKLNAELKNLTTVIKNLTSENRNLTSYLVSANAENERLSQFGGILLHNGSELFKELKTAKAEAYKEFAEKLLSCYKDFDDVNEEITLSCLKKTIEDCLKEESNV